MTIQAKSLQKLAQLCDNAKAVSFDFFDTLYVRNINNPEHVFDLVGHQFGIPNFTVLRKAAQTQAFIRMHADKKNEITLQGIYDCMQVDGASVDTLRQYEYALELALVQPNPELFALFKSLIASGKNVVVTSDMYFSEDFFRAALAPYDLAHLPLFISADRDATKRDSGALYDIVAAELGVRHRDILHIGDNPVSDVERARGKGVVAFHYVAAKLPEVDANIPSLVASVVSGLSRCSIDAAALDSHEEFGYRYGGPAVYGYLEWISEKSSRDQIDCVFFLSRDGYVLERASRLLPHIPLPRHAYFHGSRIAFTLAAIDDQNFEQFIPFLLSGSNGLSPSELLERIGVESPSPEAMKQLGLGSEVIVSVDLHPRLASFLNACKWRILKVCKENRRGLYQSIAALGLAPDAKIALVDVGWSGTTQEAFSLWAERYTDFDVRGYYFCLSDRPERVERNAKHRMSALFSSEDCSREMISGLYDNRVLMELIFSAPHNTVIGYKVAGTDTVPVEAFDLAHNGGNPEISQALTQGIERFARDYSKLQKAAGFSFPSQDLAKPLTDMALSGEWRKNLLLTAVKNFDAWAGTRNSDMYLVNY